MIRKALFQTLHVPKFNPLICVNSYPWGWVPQKFIKNSLLRSKRHDYMYESLDEFDEKEFKDGCSHVYYKIFDRFQKKKDFLDKNYCTPSLSIALNILNNCLIKTIQSPKIQKIEILDYWIEYEPTFSNHKFLGLWTNREMKLEFYKGLVGPETDLGSPLKRRVKVHFISADRHDIWILEQDLYELEWQVCNINHVLLNS
jgi:hypothetical protein